MNYKDQKTKILLSAISLLNCIIVFSQSIKAYDGHINVDINQRKIRATFEITFNTLPQDDTIKLFIHQSANIARISSNSNTIEYKELSEQFQEEDKAIEISPEDIRNKKLTIAYSHSLDRIENENFQFNENWHELNLYTAWFPLNMEYGRFEYSISAQIPENYKLVSSGTVSNNRGFWQINQKSPSFDIPIIISPQFKSISVAQESIKIHHIDLNSETEKAIENATNSHYDFLNKTLGKSSTTNLTLAVNQFNRPMSYARKGFISLTVRNSFSIKDEQILAHEIGHLWWNKVSVSNWEDWLNEGFAEYSSILILRNTYGDENFDKNIRTLEHRIKDLPSLYKLKKENTKNQSSITYKGAYLLYLLETKIGREKFSTFLRIVHQKNIKKTSDFLMLVKDELGEDVEKFLNEQMNK